MEIAKILREDFLQQNAFTDFDYTCPLNKSIGVRVCVRVCLALRVIHTLTKWFACASTHTHDCTHTQACFGV